jgi:hypothetical protein
MVHHAYVNSLAGVKSVARLIDTRYWKREGEKEREKDRDRGSRAGGNSGNTTGITGRSGNPPGGQKVGGKKGPSKQNPSPAPAAGLKGSGKQAGNSGPAATNKAVDASKPKHKPYADKLDSNGKLKPEEHERQGKLNLCMFCGGSGHSAEDCRKRPGEAQAKAASAETSSGQGSFAQASSKSKK